MREEAKPQPDDDEGQDETSELYLQARRLEELGRLAAGVAHDVNNFLTVVLGETDLLLHDGGPRTPASQEGLEGIRDAALRARTLTRQVLSLSRAERNGAEAIDVGSSLREMGDFLARLVGPGIRTRTLIEPDLPRVRMTPGRLDQVLLNLAVNARDAMPDGGVLNLSAELDRGMGQTRGGGGRPPGVLVTVSDTGTGMDEATRARIFDPFFTTKGADNGTGLGLATVAEIVREAGGRIEVDSEAGRGTAFRLHLPSAPLPEPVPPGGRKRSAVCGSNERARLLLVDDDPSIRSLVGRFLTRRGYEVTEAASGAEALDRLREAGPELRLVITDVNLPDVDGHTLSEELSREVLGLKVIFISGYELADLPHLDADRPGTGFLSKPFDLRRLAEEVERVLTRD